METKIYDHLLSSKKAGKKLLGVLLDPDRDGLEQLLPQLKQNPPDWLLVGGSLISRRNISVFLREIAPHLSCPVIIFPGDRVQVSQHADGILLLSLISGRNPEYLIGQQVVAAPLLKESGLELMPTGYILVESGTLTTAHYMSQSLPIPQRKPEMAAITALAGEQLGLKIIYLDGGSGADFPISAQMINATANMLQIPLIVGGGIDTAAKLGNAYRAGADVVVVGTAIERSPNLYKDFIAEKEKYSQ